MKRCASNLSEQSDVIELRQRRRKVCDESFDKTWITVCAMYDSAQNYS